MLSTVSVCLVVAAFSGAGLFNLIATSATTSNFLRWGYPAWWSRLTGGLEIATAILAAFPTTRQSGLIFGALIVAAAAATVLRRREFGHLAPLGLFTTFLVLAEVTSAH